MGYPIQQSTTTLPLVFLMVDDTDHVTGKTGLSPTVTLRKVGGAFGAAAGAVTEIANGWYQVAGNATDSNTLGPLILHATGTDADPTDEVYFVTEGNPTVVDKANFELTAAYDPAKTAAQEGDVMNLDPDYDPAKTAAQAGDDMDLVGGANGFDHLRLTTATPPGFVLP